MKATGSKQNALFAVGPTAFLAIAVLITVAPAASAAPPHLTSSCKPIGPRDAGWSPLEVPGKPVLDRFGHPGYLAYTSFVDVAKCNIVSGIICPIDQPSYVADCRPATSEDGGASWKIHDVPQFDIGESDLYFGRPCVARSPANPNRIWYSTSRHAWYSTPPQGGMWRSDDNGETWTENLFAGQPGSSGMVMYILPDPDDADKVFIGRGYDFGNVSVSTDAGANSTIVCGHDNVSKSGDERCAGGYVLVDFDAGLIIHKVWWQPFLSMNLDGSNPIEVSFPGVNASEGSSHLFDSLDMPVKGLTRTAGGSMGRWTPSHGFLYGSYNDGMLYYAAGGTATVSSAVQVPGVRLDVEHGNALWLAHPTENCSWVAQTGAKTLVSTQNCGRRWRALSMTGVDFSGAADERIVTGNFLPDDSGRIVIFLSNGKRYLFTPKRDRNRPPF
jgi:hypothetical protein